MVIFFSPQKMSLKFCPYCELPKNRLKYFDPDYCHCPNSFGDKICKICGKPIYFGDSPKKAMLDPHFCHCKKDRFLNNALAGKLRFKPLKTNEGKLSLHFCQCLLSYFHSKKIHQYQKRALRKFLLNSGIKTIYVPASINLRKIRGLDLMKQLRSSDYRVWHFRSNKRQISDLVLEQLDDFARFYGFETVNEHIF